jgi:ATP-binding cassette, subfamily B, bacterial MsbA
MRISVHTAPCLKEALAFPFSLLHRQPWLLARFVVGTLTRAALTSATILIIHQFLARVLGQGGGALSRLLASFSIELTLWSLVGILALVQVVSVLLAYDSRLSEQRILTMVERVTMERVIRHVLGLSVDFFDDRTHGSFVQSVRQDVTNLRQVTAAAATLLIEATQTLALVAVAVRLSPSLSFWTFVLIPIAVVPITVIARRTVDSSRAMRQKSVIVFDMLLQLVHGIRIIKIYESEAHEAARTADRAGRYFEELISIERLRARARVALDSMAGINILIVVIVGGLQVMRGALGWAELLAFFLAARAVQGPLNNINTAWLEVHRHRASVVSIEALLATRPTVGDRDDARPLQIAPARIEVSNVDFERDGRSILRDISFSVSGGETLGIVGPSGSGKTTLLNLIARFYDPSSGAIRFDGNDVRQFRVSDVHQKMAIVTQDPFLFTTTVADNIARGRPGASQPEIENAARAAEIHDEIEAMPEKYETLVGHGGRPLSRGEAQRLNIARAILKNAPILLLDEATSSLDSWSEARVQKALDRLVTGRLVFSIAHRLSTLRNASRILVLEDGRAAGLGTHHELLATCATYQRLWNAQTHAPFAEPLEASGDVPA